VLRAVMASFFGQCPSEGPINASTGRLALSRPWLRTAAVPAAALQSQGRARPAGDGERWAECQEMTKIKGFGR
jgi:hypothetical protein